MVHLKKSSIAILILLASQAQSAAHVSENCSTVFLSSTLTKTHDDKISQSGIQATELAHHLSEKISEVLEFKFIRSMAKKLGIRVWLFGGTASSFLHYVKWDLASQKGLIELQRNRFNYEFTNIFRSTQDIDIVVDASPEIANEFQNILTHRFPHFLGNRENNWEVRTLRQKIGSAGTRGYKEALLNDPDFQLQNTDSNSVGMIEITHSVGEPVIRDLKNWNGPKSIFLEDSIHNRISFFRSYSHFQTSRALAGENPEILSALRILVKAFQYNLSLDPHDLNQVKDIVNRFNPKEIIHPIAKKRIQEIAKKLIIHSSDVEQAVNQLDMLGLRKKLISMGSIYDIDSFAWWLNREPLRSRPIGETLSGPTARELNIQIVSHETKNFYASEAITRAHSGQPNAFISRQSAIGETALHGNGFYTSLGTISSVGTGLTIRFSVDPNARSGSDFIFLPDDNIVLFKNKKALKVIPESLDFKIEDLIRMAEASEKIEIHDSDRRLVEIQRRRLNSALFMNEIDNLLQSSKDEDFEKVIRILRSMHSPQVIQLISEKVRQTVIKNVFHQIQGWASSENQALIEKYIKIIDTTLVTLESSQILKTQNLIDFLNNTLKSKDTPFSLRKKSLFTLLPLIYHLNSPPFLKELFNDEELKIVQQEFWSWHRSKDIRKKRFFFNLKKNWSYSIQKGLLDYLKQFIESGLFDLHPKLPGQISILQLASYYDQKIILDWLIQNPQFDFNNKNSQGYTEVEQLILRGKTDWAQKIQKERPEAQARSFELKERNTDQNTKDYPQGTPIIDFVRIEPESFFMEMGEQQVLTTISRPFEFMSVDITQLTYSRVLELLKKYRGDDYFQLRESWNIEFIGDSFPIYGLSHNEVNLWIRGLNELSAIDSQTIQEALLNLFPGHTPKVRYQLPTEAQWEMVSRLGGVAEGDFSYGRSDIDLNDYAAYKNYYGKILEDLPPVGSKKPVFYYGKPLYDLHGLVWRWMSDWFENHLQGGTDPQGPAYGKFRVLRGGSFRHSSYCARSYHRYFLEPEKIELYGGFRLVRSVSF